MKESFICRNQNGSSVLLLVVITAIATFIVMTNMQTQAVDSYRLLKVGRLIKQDGKALRSEINLVLNSQEGCKSNLLNSVITTTTSLPLSQMVYGDGTGNPVNVLIKPSDSVFKKYGKKVIKDIFLEPHPDKFGTDSAGVHLTLLKVTFDDERKIWVPVYVTTDGSGRILACHSTNMVDTDANGAERTIEEKYCSSGPNQTSQWKNKDCMECLAGSVSFYYCVVCKRKGKTYDLANGTCS